MSQTSLASTTHHEWLKSPYLLSTDPSRLDLEALNDAFDSDLCYWAHRYDPPILDQMINGSLCFGIYTMSSETDTPCSSSTTRRPPLVGFARLVTDKTTFAYLSDLYVLPDHSGQGLATWMMQSIVSLLKTWPECRRMMLLTSEPTRKWYEAIPGAGLKQAEFERGGLVVMGRTFRGCFSRY